MKLWQKILLGILALLIAVGIYYYPKFVRLNHVQHLFDEDRIAHNFIHMGDLITTAPLQKSSQPYRFPRKEVDALPATFTYENTTFNTEEFLDSSQLNALVIIQNDTLIYETYARNNSESTNHISWSVAKSFVSAMFGIAMEEGHIKSIDQTVEEYLPEMKGTGYEGVTIKDVLQMSTGVGFNEDYGDFNSDINRYGRSFAWGSSQDEFARSLKREREPGTFNHYVSINTHILAMILVRTTGKSLAEYTQEKIWTPLGMEFDAYWLTDDYGMEMGLGGLNVAARDYAKMGQVFLHNGKWQGKQIVPAAWVKASVTPDAEYLTPGSSNSAHDMGYGYQWWVPAGDQGEFMARGIYNQYIYINPTTQTVIVKLSSNHNFNDMSNPHSSGLVHNALFRSLGAHFMPKVEEVAVLEEVE
ncbi:MAG: serine hydrolase domain-containing protein [Saprospiraceae bacterium]